MTLDEYKQLVTEQRKQQQLNTIKTINAIAQSTINNNERGNN
jgi:hypothetical protein